MPLEWHLDFVHSDIDYKNILELTNPVANIKTIFKAPTKPGVDSEKVEEK